MYPFKNKKARVGKLWPQGSRVSALGQNRIAKNFYFNRDNEPCEPGLPTPIGANQRIKHLRIEGLEMRLRTVNSAFQWSDARGAAKVA